MLLKRKTISHQQLAIISMNKFALLKLRGNFFQGFRVSLQLSDANGSFPEEIEATLPANTEIEELYSFWWEEFSNIIHNTRITIKGWKIDEDIPGNVSVNEGEEICLQYKKRLEEKLSEWLQYPGARGWQRLRERLTQELAKYPYLYLIIQTDDPTLWKLPWREWDILASYPQVGIGYTTSEFNSQISPQEAGDRVRILAVLGSNEGINLEADQELIRELEAAGAEVTFCVQPTPQELIEKLRQPPGWDIFFFAGHSETKENRGRIYLNETVSLEVNQFKNAVQEAVQQGLKIAIFNSCQGLGLGQGLAELQVPVVIFMQELVPDIVAQSFLKEFLQTYASGKPLYTAVRTAQNRLETFTKLPGCTWLPAICQNPSFVPPTWQELRKQLQKPVGSTPKLITVGLISLIIAGLLIGVRSLGLLEASELRAFDYLLKQRPPEQLDDRLLVITVSEADIQYQDSLGMDRANSGSLADEAFTQLLAKLEPYQPRIIASDIYHDFDFSPQLASKLKQKDNFYAICAVGTDNADEPGIAAPPGIPFKKVGFTDWSRDRDDVVRRQLLLMKPKPLCNTDHSISFQIALAYLAQQGITSKRNTKGNITINDVVFKQFEANAGGYQLPPDEANGYQILLNYRSTNPEQISLKEILAELPDNQLSNLVQDRIVLIGVLKKLSDLHRTPFTQGPWPEKVAGVTIQAQMTSQILSAVLDDRPLLWWWPEWIEMLWIASWSVVGGLIVWSLRSPLQLGLGIFGAITLIFALCWFSLVQGGWIPLIPAVLVLFLTSVCVALYRAFLPRITKTRYTMEIKNYESKSIYFG